MAEVAAGQWGVVSAAELAECGLNSNAITLRERNGRLHRVHRGVYAVGHPGLPWEGELAAAVKACGPTALLSHYSAAELWGFVERLDRIPDVMVWAAGSRSHPGIRVRRTLRLEPVDRAERLRIPVTSAARTLLDLASSIGQSATRVAVRSGIGLGLVTVRQLGWVLARYQGARGCGILRDAIASGAAPTKSERESDVLDLILQAGFASPDVNAPLSIDGRRVIPDFRWPEQRLILEVDSTAWHENPLARADDRERQALLEAHGETVLRTHWRDAVLGPHKLIERLRTAGAPYR